MVILERQSGHLDSSGIDSRPFPTQPPSESAIMAAGNTFDPSVLSGVSAAFEEPFNFDDNVVFADGLDDNALFPTDWDQAPPYPIQQYAAPPPNWNHPQPKVEPVPMAAYATASVLTPAQQEKLRQIAMPGHLQYRGSNSPVSAASTKSHSGSSPESNSNTNGKGRKRKSSLDIEDDDDDDESGEQHPPVKKTAHNMIEKRYRTNLNDKIAALRDSVPSLRIMSKSAKGEDTADDREDLQGLTPAHKLNKATVCSFQLIWNMACIWGSEHHLLEHDTSMHFMLWLNV